LINDTLFFSTEAGFRPPRGFLNAARRNRNFDANNNGTQDFLFLRDNENNIPVELIVRDGQSRDEISRIDLTHLQGWQEQGKLTANFLGFDQDEAIISYRFDDDIFRGAVIELNPSSSLVSTLSHGWNDSLLWIVALDLNKDGIKELLGRNTNTGAFKVYGRRPSGMVLGKSSIKAAQLELSSKVQNYQIEYESDESGFVFGFEDLDGIGDNRPIDMDGDGVLEITLFKENDNGVPVEFVVIDGATFAEKWKINLANLPLRPRKLDFYGFYDLDADEVAEAVFGGDGFAVVDPVNNTLELGPETFTNWQIHGIIDIDDDGYPEIIADDTTKGSVIVFGSSSVTGVAADNAQTPDAFGLSQNYPNPFNPTTRIEYSVPNSSDVQVRIFNTLGEIVRTLVNGYKEAGIYSVKWDGTNDAGQRVASGVYYYQLNSRNLLSTRQMLLLK
jgi:hypothetical protein